eukprot:CAMPEP_0118921796 /NCGR_PEP_ID=MMETSP1169-20130426/960_1 /TAXON_ID=36882 /ORGANISM="Pyramimonas obovata, Strain CCMP722" /LENGTH=147 /DNA_ID=CAMNT_0006862581 /DNA_START=105 /DNA_END=548 /DNA_ORIENTATION=-
MTRSTLTQLMRFIFAVLCLVAVHTDAVTLRPKGTVKRTNRGPERRQLAGHGGHAEEEMGGDEGVVGTPDSFPDMPMGDDLAGIPAGCEGPQCETGMVDHMEEMIASGEHKTEVFLPGCQKTVEFSTKMFKMMQKAPALPRDSVVCPN